MSRTPLRDQFRRRPATPTTVARTTTAQGRKRNVALGLVPSSGWGAWHRRHLTLPSTNAPNFHTLVCRHQPARAIRTKARTGLRSGMDSSRHSFRHTRAPASSCSAIRWNAPSHSSFPRKRESRGGVVGGANDTRALSPTSTPNSHTLVCRHQPARAIRTKARSGLRSGTDGSRHDRWTPLPLVILAKAGIQRMGCGWRK